MAVFRAAESLPCYRTDMELIAFFLVALGLVVVLIGLMFWFFFLRGR
jgi:hypothetical protein